jgi:hypothetical protein
MALPDDTSVWSRNPSTVELCRRAREAVADSKVTIAQTRRLLDECWQQLHRYRWAHEERPPVESEDAGGHQGDGAEAEQG